MFRRAYVRKLDEAHADRVEHLIEKALNIKDDDATEVVYIGDVEFQELFILTNELLNTLAWEINDDRIVIHQLAEWIDGDYSIVPASTIEVVIKVWEVGPKQLEGHFLSPFNGGNGRHVQRLVERYIKPYHGRSICYELVGMDIPLSPEIQYVALNPLFCPIDPALYEAIEKCDT